MKDDGLGVVTEGAEPPHAHCAVLVTHGQQAVPAVAVPDPGDRAQMALHTQPHGHENSPPRGTLVAAMHARGGQLV
jgi:hypothetical protein